MELIKGGPYLNKHYHRFVPYRHYSIDNMWLVLQYQDIYPENSRKNSNIVKTLEHRWNIIADTPLLAALGAQKNWERDDTLICKYKHRTTALNRLFEDFRSMTLDNIKNFQKIADPLMNELEKRNKKAEFVSDAQFYANLIIMINRFNKIIKDITKKEKRK